MSGARRVCIYTAAFGGYDELKPAVAQTIPTDFFCFTDGRAITPRPPWILRRSRARRPLSPRMRAKWFKTHPHLLFPGGRTGLRADWRGALLHPARRYDLTIWIDASLEVTSPHFAEEVATHLRGAGLAVFPHPDRACIFDEARASTHWAKYAGQRLLEQADAYRTEGYPAQAGLWAAGVLVRDTAAAHLPALDEAWWRENLLWTYQDQLSLPVVWWRQGRRFDVIGRGLWTNAWLRYHPHPREEGVLAAYR